MRLRTLGGLELETASIRRVKPLLLLCYLAVEGPKEHRFLAELFWPNTVDPLNSLSKALTRLRQGAPGSVEADDVRAWANVPTDVEEMLSALEQDDFEQGLERYDGPFLEGVSFPNWSSELEEWVYKTRELLAERVQEAHLQLGERAAAKGEFLKAARHGEEAYRLSSTSGLEPNSGHWSLTAKELRTSP